MSGKANSMWLLHLGAAATLFMEDHHSVPQI